MFTSVSHVVMESSVVVLLLCCAFSVTYTSEGFTLRAAATAASAADCSTPSLRSTHRTYGHASKWAGAGVRGTDADEGEDDNDE